MSEENEVDVLSHESMLFSRSKPYKCNNYNSFKEYLIQKYCVVTRRIGSQGYKIRSLV